MADFGEREAVEGGDGCGDGLEDVLDEVGLVFSAGEGEDEVAEDFPIVAGLAGQFDGAVEALEAAGEIDHRAAFFGEGGGGQHEVGGEGGGVGEDVGLEQEIEFREVGEMEAGVGDEVFAEDEQRLDVVRSGRRRGWRRVWRRGLRFPE